MHVGGCDCLDASAVGGPIVTDPRCAALDGGPDADHVDDLVTWLRAQLDEDERVAKMAEILDPAPWANRVSTTPGGHVEGRIAGAGGHTVVHVKDQAPDFDSATHIARWDPARVLAEVDAKRRILELHAPVIDGTQSSWTWFAGSESASEAIVKLLALPYADRPGYRSEWRP
jgi:hypothetical protein